MSVTLIDSSIWIGFTRGSLEVKFRDEVGVLLTQGRAAICPVVWAELHSGTKSKKEEALLKNIRSVSVWLEHSPKVWDETYRLAKLARARGVNCPLSDIIIVACSNCHSAPLLHQDKHLTALAKL